MDETVTSHRNQDESFLPRSINANCYEASQLLTALVGIRHRHVQTWPEKALVIVGVNAETGERRAFDRNTGVELVDAVMATTAFWGWPPAFFEGYHYIDGGFYSSDNADVASGFDQVLILALRPPAPSLCVASLDEAVESLRAGGAQVEVVHPDEDCLAAFASVGGPMNPAVRAPAAKAGRAQGQRLGEGGLLSL